MVERKQRLQRNTIVFIQKMKMGCAPECLPEQVRYVEAVKPYNLKNALDFRPSRAYTNVVQRSQFSKGLNIYNRMPADVKTETNVNISRKHDQKSPWSSRYCVGLLDVKPINK